jgi:hypothetical protein
MVIPIATGVNGNENFIAGMPDNEGNIDEPTVDTVMGLLKDNREYFRPFHSQCWLEDDYYYGRNSVPSPEGFEPVRPATATAIINVASDHVDTNNLTIDVPLASPRARARAERLKKFYEGAWLSMKDPVKQTAVKHAFAYGVGWIKSMWNADKWPDAPVLDDFPNDEEYREELKKFMEARNIAFPFEDSNPDPKNMVWDDSKIKTKWVIEFYQTTTRFLKNRYPEWMGTTDNTLTEWVEYWDEEWYGVVGGNDWIKKPVRHGYGHLPYTMVHPNNSLNWSEGFPHLRYRGINNPIHSLLDEEARLLTAYEAQVRQYAWRTIDIHGNKTAAQAVADEYELFGAINVIPTGIEVKESPKITPPQDTLLALNIVQTAIEEATFPNVIRGVRPKGVSSGFGVSVLAGMGRLVFQGVANGMARAIEQINSKRAMLVENKARGRITVHARSTVHNFDQTIGPDDVNGYYENRVTLTAEAPEESERRALLAMRLFQANMISLYEAQRRAGILNPLEEQMQMTAEALLMSDEMRAQQMAIALERMGLINQLQQAVSLGGVGGGGAQGGNAGQFLPGQAQQAILGQANNQQARTASAAGQPSVFPQGQGGINILGRRLGNPGGGATGVPSGQTVR